MSNSFVTPWTIAHQTPLYMRFSRQEYWNRLSFPSPRDLPDSGIQPESLGPPAVAGIFFTREAPISKNWLALNVTQHVQTLEISSVFYEPVNKSLAEKAALC